MKTRTTCLGAILDGRFTISHPDRTAYRDLPSWDYQVREWPSAGALKETLRQQEQREARPGDWRPWRWAQNA